LHVLGKAIISDNEEKHFVKQSKVSGEKLTTLKNSPWKIHWPEIQCFSPCPWSSSYRELHKGGVVTLCREMGVE
jgi:hypothetical protein